MKTQNAKILSALKRGQKLTPLQALDRFGAMRLASRIGELRERGWRIRTERYTLRSGKVVARYFLTGRARRRRA